MAIPHTSISYYKNRPGTEQGEFGEKGLQNGSSFALRRQYPGGRTKEATEIVYIAKIKPAKTQMAY